MEGPSTAHPIQQIADQIIAQIKAGAGEWRMPWHKGMPEPYNPVTGKRYKGHNAVILWSAGMSRGYQHGGWATMRQWRKLGGMLRKGAKGVAIFRPGYVLTPDLWQQQSPMMTGFRRYTVFHYSDVNRLNLDYPDMFTNEQFSSSPRAIQAKDIANKVKAEWLNKGDRALYKPYLDQIWMPEPSRFFPTISATAEEHYDMTLLHELVHWTSKPHRCNRQPRFQDDHSRSYAFEELVAELGNAILATRLHQIPCPRHDHAAYINSWLSELNMNFVYFYEALALASAAANWLCEQAEIPGFYDEMQFTQTEPAINPSQANSTNGVSKPIAALLVTCLSNQTISFPTFRRWQLTCGNCKSEFQVTLHRNDLGSHCSRCRRYNYLTLPA